MSLSGDRGGPSVTRFVQQSRGDAEPAEWERIKALARQQHVGLVSRYLLGQPQVGEFLTEGLEKMLEYGVD
jgi:hypothetical protein